MTKRSLHLGSNKRTRLAVLALTLLALYIGFTTWRHYRATQDYIAEFRENHTEHYRQLIKNEVSRTLHYLEDELGDNPSPQAVRHVSTYLATVRFGNGDRLFAADCSNDRETALFGVYPLGTDLRESDPDIYAIVLTLKQKALDGGGYIEYPFNDEAKPDRRAKISYIAPMTRWGWFVGAGTHIPDIEAEIQAMAHAANVGMAWNLAGGVFCIAAVLIALRALTRGKAELQASEHRHKTYIRHSPYCIFVTDPTGRILHVNDTATTQTGYDRDTLKTMCLIDLISPDPDARAHADKNFQRLFAEGKHFSEERARRKNGAEFTMSFRAVRLSGDRYIAFGIDITERILATQRQKRLMSELDHRVKNTLASVLSLLKQTASHADSYEDFIESFSKRIISMARTHEALAATKWSDISLQDLIDLALPEHDGSPVQPVRLQGPAVQWSSQHASSLCMILHELATNARKYGALGAPGGTVDIHWQNESPKKLTLQWRERGGPLIHQPPTPGFGLSLIKGFVEYELTGDVQFVYHNDGLECKITLPTRPTTPHNFSSTPPITIQTKGAVTSQ